MAHTAVWQLQCQRDTRLATEAKTSRSVNNKAKQIPCQRTSKNSTQRQRNAAKQPHLIMSRRRCMLVPGSTMRPPTTPNVLRAIKPARDIMQTKWPRCTALPTDRNSLRPFGPVKRPVSGCLQGCVLSSRGIDNYMGSSPHLLFASIYRDFNSEQAIRDSQDSVVHSLFLKNLSG